MSRERRMSEPLHTDPHYWLGRLTTGIEISLDTRDLHMAAEQLRAYVEAGMGTAITRPHFLRALARWDARHTVDGTSSSDAAMAPTASRAQDAAVKAQRVRAVDTAGGGNQDPPPTPGSTPHAPAACSPARTPLDTGHGYDTSDSLRVAGMVERGEITR